MNNIVTIDPETVVAQTDAQFFMVVWANSQGIFFGTGGGSFQNVSHGQMDSPAIDRRHAVEEYYNLVRVAKAHNILVDGQIDLIPLTTFSS